MSFAVTLGDGTTNPDDFVRIDMWNSPLKLDVTREELVEVQPRVAMKLGEPVILPSLRTQVVRLIN